MSLFKYLQFFKENGFFAGSIIRVTVEDSTFFGQDLTLSKNGSLLATKAIGEGGVTDIFTDESGVLSLSAENRDGSATVSGSVEVTAYATYNVTLNAQSSNTKRYAYADGDVTFDGDATSGTVDIAYTGDISQVSAASSDTSLATVSVSGNVVTVRDAGRNFNGTCEVTATVAQTGRYGQAAVTFNVNKLNGIYGSWEDASDSVIANMVAMADEGTIDLADFWSIGETRRVHLNEIAAGTATAKQVEQDIDLVLMHNPLGDANYMLTAKTAGNRYQPNFIIGVKECLENLSVAGYVNKQTSVTYSSYTHDFSGYLGAESEILSVLNDGFVKALPNWLQGCLKSTERYYAGASEFKYNASNRSYYPASMYQKATKSHKVSLPNIVELGFTASFNASSNSSSRLLGDGVYYSVSDTKASMASYVFTQAYSTVDKVTSDINGVGTRFSHAEARKRKGISGSYTDYLVIEEMFGGIGASYEGAEGESVYRIAYFVDENGMLQSNNLDDQGQREKLRGVSPIMFI